MRVSISRNLILLKFYPLKDGTLHKNRSCGYFRKFHISFGSYYLEERDVDGKKWLCIEGLDIGQKLEFWLELEGTSMKPCCQSAKEFFGNDKKRFRVVQ